MNYLVKKKKQGYELFADFFCFQARPQDVPDLGWGATIYVSCLVLGRADRGRIN